MYEKLRLERKNNKIKVKELLDAVEVKTVGAYYKKENGIIPITILQGIKLCKKLGTTLNDLFLPNNYLNKIEIKRKEKLHE